MQQNSIEGTGCTNSLCPGFVQTSTKIYIGSPFTNVSSVGGPQFSMLLYLAQVSFMLLIFFFLKINLIGKHLWSLILKKWMKKYLYVMNIYIFILLLDMSFWSTYIFFYFIKNWQNYTRGKLSYLVITQWSFIFFFCPI